MRNFCGKEKSRNRIWTQQCLPRCWPCDLRAKDVDDFINLAHLQLSRTISQFFDKVFSTIGTKLFVSKLAMLFYKEGLHSFVRNVILKVSWVFFFFIKTYVKVIITTFKSNFFTKWEEWNREFFFLLWLPFNAILFICIHLII